MQHIDMEKFANGAFTEQINRELKKVTENIQDPNTDATAKRRITVVIEFKPNEVRNFVTTGVQAKSTLAPALGAVTALSMGKNIRTNEVWMGCPVLSRRLMRQRKTLNLHWQKLTPMQRNMQTLHKVQQ